MKTSIQSVSDVVAFFIQLFEEESLNFHPDEDFHNYINQETRLPSYSPQEAELRNQLMESSFEICEREGVNIYGIGIELLFNKLQPSKPWKKLF